MINKFDNRFLIIGIGVVFYLFITTYAYLFQEWTRLFALNFANFPSIPLFFFIQFVYVLTIVLFCFFFQSKLKKQKLNSKKLFIQLAIAMIVGQFLQFISRFVFDLFTTPEYWDRLIAYSDEIRSDYALGSIAPSLSLLIDLFLIYFFYKNRNLLIQLDANSEEIETIGS